MAIPKELAAIVASNFDLTKMSEVEKLNKTLKVAQRAYESAVKYGIDPTTLFKLIQSESGWNLDTKDSSTGAIGMGQILASTGQGLGLTTQDLRDPFKNVDATARYLAQQIDYFGGDVQKGLAAYRAGAGTVQAAVSQAQVRGTDWISEADRIGAQYGQGDHIISDYLGLTGHGPTLQENANLSQYGATTPRKLPKAADEPNPEEFYIDPMTGQPGDPNDPSSVLDVKSYRQAYNDWQNYRKGGREDLSNYLNTVIQSISADLANKRLSTDQANAELNARIGALGIGSDEFTKLIGTSVKRGTQYIPGREPGGVYASLGAHPLAPLPAAQDTYNPFQNALGVMNSGPMPTSVGTADTSGYRGLPSVAASGGVETLGGQAMPAGTNATLSSFQAALDLIRRLGGPAPVLR